MKRLNQTGSHLVAVLIIVLVLAVAGITGWRVYSSKNNKSQTDNSQQSATTGQKAITAEASPIVWMWSGEKWVSSKTAPSCDDPLVFKQSPADVSKASSVLYPGQQRSTGYKPHGGLRFTVTDQITVRMPIDAFVVSGSRYIEAGETQYMFFFETSCGLAFRFDHLLTLDPKFQALADKLPSAKPDDSRTTNFETPASFRAGDVVATAVGFPKMDNISFDFGVYDLRQRNSAASSASYVAKHKDELSQAAYGVCWFDMLPSKDAATVKGLPAADQAAGKTSDYCK